MIHFKYNDEHIIEDDIQNGDWLLMSYQRIYHFNREEFREWCLTEHWDYLKTIGRTEIDEDGLENKYVGWEDLDLDMEFAWLVEAVVTGKIKHYKISYE